MRADASGGPERPEINPDVAGTPVYDAGEKEAKGRSGAARSRNAAGGVISPLAGNLYLHWFDKEFHRPGAQAQLAGAKLVRYATILWCYRAIGQTSVWLIESKLEQWLKLVINRTRHA